MNFREAMAGVRDGRTVRVIPLDTHWSRPHLVRVDYHPDLDQKCLQCLCLTEDGQRIEPGEVWEPACYLFCCEDYLDGEWEVVDADDHTCGEVDG